LDALESGPFVDDDSGFFNACGRRSNSAESAEMLTNGVVTSRGGSGQAARSNIQANLKPAIRMSSAQCAAENNAIYLIDRLMNGHQLPEPRMPRIKQLS
jgi:hypothetical protein